MILAESITYEPVRLIDLELLKNHLRIEPEYTGEDLILHHYVDAGVEAIEKYIGSVIRPATHKIVQNEYADCIIVASPLRVVGGKSVSVKYKSSEEWNDLPEAKYKTIKTGNYCLVQFVGVLPAASEIEISFLVGYPVVALEAEGQSASSENGVSFPSAIIQALLLTVADFYQRREDRAEVTSTAVHSLLRPYRIYT